MEVANFNLIELKKQVENFRKKEKELLESLAFVKKKIESIEYVIEENEITNQRMFICVPIDFVTNDFNKSTTKTKWNWKKIVMELFLKNGIPMSTETLYSKYLINYENPDRNRLFVIRNISAALHYLVKVDQKLAKLKIPRIKGFVYTPFEYLENSGQLKEYYFKQLFI